LPEKCCHFLKFLIYLYLIIGIGAQAVGQTYVFAQLTGTPMNTTGWNLQGDARVGNMVGTADSELIICRRAPFNSGAVFYNQPVNLSLCNHWIAQFDFRMFDGTGADGIAFCFLQDPPSGFVDGGGLGIPNLDAGLMVCFDTWNNCISYDPSTVHQDMPKIEIRLGLGYDQSMGADTINGECLMEPTLANTNGALSFIRGPDYNRAKIVYDTGMISVYVNDVFYLSSYTPSPVNFTGYMGFTASTGGYTDDHSIKNVIIYTQMPSSYAGNPVSACPGGAAQLGGPPTDTGYSYAWSPATGLSDTTASAPVVRLPNNTPDSQIYKYYVRTTFTHSSGCPSVDSVLVKVFPNPKVHFTMPKICVSDGVGQFYDSSYTLDSETLPFSWLWYFGDPAAGPGNTDTSTAPDPSHRYIIAANYDMSLIVTNSEGCIDSLDKVFTVNGSKVQAAFDVGDPTGLCSGQNVEITNLSTVDFGSVVAVEIYWGDTAGTGYTDSLPFPGKVYSHTYPDPLSTNTAYYTIRMVSGSGYSCQNESDQPVAIKPSPHDAFAAIPPICDYDTLVNVAIYASELTGMAGSYFFEGGAITKEGVFSPQRAGPGTDSLLYIYSAADGCSDTTYQSVYVQALPQVNAGRDTSVVVNQPLQLHAVSSDGNGDSWFSWFWSPPEGLSNPGIADPIGVYSADVDSIRYMVIATDSLGCIGTAGIKVTVYKTQPDIFVPNAFTPGRTNNGTFRPIPVGIFSLQFFRVYNRQGELVYSTSRIGDGWDGEVSGKTQVPGTYVWEVQGTTYSGKAIMRKGTMILIR
jgi:Bacterial lectin/CHU_C Type IX secretion signal domain/PKD domain